MKHPFARTAATALAALIAFAAAAPAAAQTQTWNYKSYRKDPLSGQYDKARFLSSTIRLDEKDGKATFRMITTGRGDPCISRSDLPAEVERTPDTLILTVRPETSGCEPFRYLIRTDGSGGVRQHLRNERWVDDGFDHGLTPAN